MYSFDLIRCLKGDNSQFYKTKAAVMTADIVSIAYATSIAAGGIMGYIKAGSVPSLAMGLTFGGIMGLGAVQTSYNPENFGLSLGTSLTLAGIMGFRFAQSKKFMPAGLVFTLSTLMVIRFGSRLVQRYR